MNNMTLETTAVVANTPDVSTLLEVNSPKVSPQHFLSFRIATNTDGSHTDESNIYGMLRANYLTEILTLSADDMVAIPMTAAGVIGVHNWRGEVLWLVDTGCSLGLQPIVHRHHPFIKYSVIVVQHHLGNLGLVVEQVNQLIELDLSEIQTFSPTAKLPLAAAIQLNSPCVSGYWQTPQQSILLEINLEALIKQLRG